MFAALDAEGSDFFRDTQDIMPALNYGIDFLMMAVNQIRETNKVSNEVFKELRYNRIYQTSKFSRITIDNSVFSIDAVVPLPITNPLWTKQANSTPEKSILLNSYIFVESNFDSCGRLTSEEWQTNRFNPFAPGAEYKDYVDLKPTDTCSIKFGYQDALNYQNANLDIFEIEVRPKLVEKPVAIVYVKNHPRITSTSDNIYFSNNIVNFIVQNALNYISYQQGDNTTLWNVSEQDRIALLNFVK